ncbi:hypothetical protein HYV70_04390 [Candidatus Uhrbacteria bacterium]|nr:hypothetical protein [Candidatus Uhrbacteria bacterium]
MAMQICAWGTCSNRYPDHSTSVCGARHILVVDNNGKDEKDFPLSGVNNHYEFVSSKNAGTIARLAEEATAIVIFSTTEDNASIRGLYPDKTLVILAEDLFEQSMARLRNFLLSGILIH